jgi:hypothetical protein
MRTRTGRIIIAALSLLAAAAIESIASLASGAPSVGGDLTPDRIFSEPRNEESKEEIAAEDAALQAYGEAHPAPVPEDPEEAGPERDPTDFIWEAGIFEDAEFPAGTGLTFQNRWQGHIDGWHVIVYAGSYSGDSQVGVVLLQLKDPVSWGNKFAGPFESPVAGPLRIESAEGPVLTISGAEGGRVRFDVATRTFG